MTIRLAVVSTAANTDRILKALSGSGVEIALHLGDTSADYKASTLSRITARNGRKGHLMADDRFRGGAQGMIEAPDHAARLEEFIDQMHRVGPGNALRAHPLRTMPEFTDYYAIITDMLATRLTEARATHVLFFNVPHLAYDTALYQVARQIGLPTLIVTQSLFPDQFFSLTAPHALGGFDPTGSDAPPWPIAKGEKPDLFYMTGIKQEREAGGRPGLRPFLSLLAYLAFRRPAQALNPAHVWRLWQHMRRVYAALPAWRDPFAKFFHADDLEYFDHLATFEDQTLDLTGDYVYFPLQLQPEMTTSALGGPYRDQALAIERLAGILPGGVRILVKENPKQHGYMRGPLFFHRLARIPAVTFLPSWADTRALTDNACAVATITGTAGWEAIRSGKPALVFGAAWYRSLPGVTRWHEGLTWDALLAAAPDHDALQQAAGALLSRTHDGVVDRHYTKLVAGFDEAANAARVAGTIRSLLDGRLQPTFSADLT